MKLRFVAALAAVLLLAGGAVVWHLRSPGSAGASGPAVPPKVATPPAPGDKSAVTLAVEPDKTQVFQRAFWRRPTAGDRILHAERREWSDAAGVQKWQWFIVVDPSPEFRRWLIEENPFELAALAPGVEEVVVENAPKWFPGLEARAALAQYRNRGGRLIVLLDRKSGRLYATDGGSGFAAPRS